MPNNSARDERRAPRPSVVPPAPLPSYGFGILSEVPGEDLGLVLWRAVRDVQRCSDVPLEERHRLIRAPTTAVQERYAVALAETPELASPLATFALMLRAPSTVPNGELASACREVYTWADARSYKRTALHFAEAAAYADPSDSELANFAARTARRAFLKDRAALWYARAHRLAVLAKNQREAVFALLGYGTMMKDAGNYDEARRAFERGARRATSTHRRREAADAYHDLLALALDQRRLKLGEVYARKALWIAPVRHPRFPAFAYDVAFLMLCRFHFAAAVSILEKTVPLIRRPEERALVLSALSWAASAAGWSSRGNEAERAALELLANHDDYAPGVYIHLADAARAQRDWGRAERFAILAQELAVNREEPGLDQIATALRAAIEAHEEHPAGVPVTEATGALLRSILARFGRWRAPGDRKT